MVSVLSIVASVTGLAIVMGPDPTHIDLFRAGVCFALSIGMMFAQPRDY